MCVPQRTARPEDFIVLTAAHRSSGFFLDVFNKIDDRLRILFANSSFRSKKHHYLENACNQTNFIPLLKKDGE